MPLLDLHETLEEAAPVALQGVDRQLLVGAAGLEDQHARVASGHVEAAAGEHHRAVELADGSITSPFLEKFGRSPRDTGLQSERNKRPTATQRLHLLNSSHILRKIEYGPKIRPLLRSTDRNSVREIAEELYLIILSRN